ncbi:MAG: hypothetical protein EOO88_50635 [Pedobacter sp.]|nr:MAG: hypothetical protein EOO88_50635 [Pedobacter sp.]
MRIPLFLLLITIAFISCRKNQRTCKGNCVDVKIGGRVFVPTTNKGIKDVPIEAFWAKKGCLNCTSYTITAGRTDSDGKFMLTRTIDSSFFRDYRLVVRIPNDTSYYIFPYPGSTSYQDTHFDQYDVGALQNIKIECFPKTFLTIKLRRTMADDFHYFFVQHYFNKHGFGGQEFSIIGPQAARDTTYQVQTSPDVYTKIQWTKKLATGEIISEQIDSLICPANGSAVFEIDY